MSRRPTDVQTVRELHRAGALAGATVRLREAPTPELWRFLERHTNPENAPRALEWRSPWEGHDVDAIPGPTCAQCGCRTWDSNHNADPRGAIGLRLYSPLHATDYGHTGPDYPLCYGCAQDEPKYRAAVAEARQQWKPGTAPTPMLELEVTP